MTLTGFRSRNHPQQVARRAAARDDVDDRRTPRELFDAWNARYRFSLDAAASRENALCVVYCSIETSGLAVSWSGHRVWCNPPYSAIGAWVRKAHDEMRNGCEAVVMLLPANRTEQSWWQELVEPYRDQASRDGVRLQSRFLPGRLRFGRPGWAPPPKGDRPPFGCVVLAWERAA